MGSSVISRRWGLFINYLSIIMILVIFYMIKFNYYSKIYLVLEAVPVIMLLLSFSRVFGKSGLWKLTHSNKKELDERELLVLYKATSLSYGIFIVVTLVIIYTFALVQKGPIDVMLAAALLYFAHTLPAAIIVCRVKQV